MQTAEETAKEGSDPEQASLAFICKRLKLNLKKLSEEEKKWLKKIAQKSDLLKIRTHSGGENREREIGGSKGAGGNYKIETSRSNARRSER